MKRLLPLAALMLAPQLHAIELKGTYIPQPGFEGSACDPNENSPTDYINQAVDAKRATPRNCSTMTNSNPVFFWSLPYEAMLDGNMTLTVKGPNGYTKSIVTKRPRLIYPEKLADGKYTWQVTFVAKTGGTRSTQVRNFIIAANGKEPIPSADEIVTAVKGHAHPRFLPQGATFAKIIERINADPALKASFNGSKWVADRYVEGKVVNGTDFSMSAEPTLQPITQEYTSMLGRVANKERAAIETLGHMYFLTNDLRYANECAKRLRNIASWDADENASTGEKTQDQANRQIYLALGLGLDIFQSAQLKNMLTSDEITLIVQKMRKRIGYVYPGKLDGYDLHPYNGHVGTASQYITEALMYAIGTPGYDDTATEDTLRRAYSELIMGAGAWGGTSDGAFGNSTSYGWYTSNIYARTLAMLKLITGKSFKDYRPLSGIGMNLIAQTPPGGHDQMGAFGNGTEQRALFRQFTRDDFRLLAHVTELPEYEWYWRSYTQNLTSTNALQPFHYMMLGYGPSKAPATPPTIPNAFLFEDAGYVAFHSNAMDPLRTSLFFRSSPLGTENHSHGDNNSFNFFSNGEPVFISSGFYYSYFDPHLLQWTRQTKSKNALTFSGTDVEGKSVSGIGQAEAPKDVGKVLLTTKTSGKLINYYASDEWMVATGDATKAYRRYTDEKTSDQLLTSALRTVVYNKAHGIVVVYDYASSLTPRSWELNFHTAYEPKLQGNTGININEANVCTVLKGAPASFLNIDLAAEGIPMPPKEHDAYVFPQYHTRWKTDGTSTEFAAVTVIKQNCGMSTTQDYLTGSKSAMKVTFGTKSVIFDKGNVKFE
jgi:hypothetical protein